MELPWPGTHAESVPVASLTHDSSTRQSIAEKQTLAHAPPTQTSGDGQSRFVRQTSSDVAQEPFPTESSRHDIVAQSLPKSQLSRQRPSAQWRAPVQSASLEQAHPLEAWLHPPAAAPIASTPRVAATVPRHTPSAWRADAIGVETIA
jgi:hypothetical protein